MLPSGDSDRANSQVDVAVVVVTYNSSEHLPEFFDSLPGALHPLTSYEVVVVDNASHDGSATVAGQLWPEATVIQMGGNLGYAAGVNAGVAMSSSSQAVLVLNPDVRLGRGSVPTLLHALSPETGIAVPRLMNDRGRLIYSLRREPAVLRVLGEALLGGDRAGRFRALGEVVAIDSIYEAPVHADWASGAAMLISRECMDRVGPWDESFFLYAEEAEFALRARDAGFLLLYVPAAEAVHIGGEVHRSAELWTLNTLNRWRLFSRRNGRLRSRAFWLSLVVNEGLRAAMGRGPHRAALRALLRSGINPPAG
jgi:GT2 family glycosyltransferase